MTQGSGLIPSPDFCSLGSIIWCHSHPPCAPLQEHLAQILLERLLAALSLGLQVGQ